MDQLDAIRKVTMARIVCDNTDLGETQPNIFMTEDNAGNRMTSCSDTNTIPELDWAPFKEDEDIYLKVFGNTEPPSEPPGCTLLLHAACKKFYVCCVVQFKDAVGEISTVGDAAHLSNPAAYGRETVTAC